MKLDNEGKTILVKVHLALLGCILCLPLMGYFESEALRTLAAVIIYPPIVVGGALVIFVDYRLWTGRK